MSAMPPADASIAAHLPDGWKALRLRDVLVRTQYGLTAPVLAAGATPIVGMKDLAHGRVLTANLAYVAMIGVDVEPYRLQVGDILLNRTNSPELVGKIGIVEEQTDAVFASYLVRLRANIDVVSPVFLNAWLNTSSVRQMVDRIATRAVSQANINPTRFVDECYVPVPPRAEQDAISAVLSTWPTAVRTGMRLQEKLLQRKRLLLRHLLHADSRRVRHSGDYEQAELGRHAEIVSGQHVLAAKVNAIGNGQPYLTGPADFSRGTAITTKWVTHAPAVCRAGDTLVTVKGSGAGTVFSADKAYAISRQLMAIRLRAGHPRFLYHVMHAALSELHDLTHGTIPQLTTADLFKLRIILPPSREQEKLAEILDNADEALSATRRLTERIEEQHQVVRSRLLLGMNRVSATDITDSARMEVAHA